MELADIRKISEDIKYNIGKVIVGKGQVIDLVLVALLCSGHVLLEDVPGVGKTMLARCLARSIDCDFKRIQFTPDLLPSDLTGINFFNQKKSDFVFRPGPVFSNILLADELNRATPRTQSSLLECMEEKQVTIDGTTRHLSDPFFVIATQNPVETHGTFPLPEAQLDRFFMRLKMGYPLPSESRSILNRFEKGAPYEEITAVLDKNVVIDAKKSVIDCVINNAVKEYIVDIIEATRSHMDVSLGVSPRGCIALMKAARVFSVLNGRSFVMPDDVKSVAIPVLAHRLIIRGSSASKSMESQEKVMKEILESVPVPVEDFVIQLERQ